MGSKRNHLETVIAQKNEQILKLKSQQEALIARNTLLQARLLSTLDALDAMQNARAQDSNSALKTENRLNRKLGRYIAVVREAEEERDDMRDAILKLVEKVELSNGYESLPHGQFRLASLSEPCPPAVIKPVQVPEEDALTYASSMIQALRQQRDNERKSHAQTREIYDARLTVLEAKLSRRESELESCSCLGRNTPVPTPIHHPISSFRRHHPEPVDVANDSEDMFSIFYATAARNRSLEVEVRTLSIQLERARQAQSALGSNQVDSKDQPPTSGSSRIATDELPLRTPRPVNNPRRGRRDDIPPCTIPSNTEGSHLLADLNREVQDLAEKIDAIADERTIFFGAMPQLSATTNPCQEAQARIAFLEVECSRLQRSENYLLEAVQSIRNTSYVVEREDQLVDEEPPAGEIVPTSPANFRQSSPIHDLLSPDDGEKPMELSTPLLPVSMMVNDAFPSPTPEGHATICDPTSMPLPPSPIITGVNLDEATLTSSPPEVHLDTRCHDLYLPSSAPHIQQVELDLVETEFQLQAGENALNDIEGLVRQLHST